MPQDWTHTTFLHGETVEVVGDAFVAGAWNAPFPDLGMFEATTVMGSGGRATRDSVSFCNASHPFTEMFSARVDDVLHFSNSLPLLFARTDDGPDIRYRHYHRDRAAAWHAGTVASPYTVPTRRGRDVLGYFGLDVEVRPDLSVVTRSKRDAAPCTTFAEYQAMLADTVRCVIENAQDRTRRHPLRALTTLSSGYDSIACSILGMKAGIRDAITFTTRRDQADNGSRVGKMLGLNVVEYDNDAWRHLSSAPEIEFSASASGTTNPALAVLDDGWNDSVVLAGGLGDAVWGIGPGAWGDGLAQPGEGTLSTQSAHEYALRAGVLLFLVPTIDAVHFREIEAISTSTEMAPWTIGGEYDRPIPRRIIEEAGIPRGSFAIAKRASIAVFKDDLLDSEARVDFRQFWREALARQTLVRRLLYRAEVASIMPLTNLVGGVLLKLNRLRGTRRRMRMWVRHGSLPDAYRFHWAVTRLRDRYSSQMTQAPRQRAATP